MRALRTLTMFADFHAVDGSDHVIVPTDAADTEPRFVPTPGDFVILHDGGDFQCLALVDAIEGDLLDMKVDWSTWRRRDSLHIEQRTGVGATPPIASDRQATFASH